MYILYNTRPVYAINDSLGSIKDQGNCRYDEVILTIREERLFDECLSYDDTQRVSR